MPPAETPLSEVASAPYAVAPMTGMRGMVVIAGRKALQRRGLLGAHEALVPAEHRAALAAATAGELLPMPIVHAHESAFDRLGLPRDEARALGAEMSRAMHGIVFSTIARLAGRLGTSPWLVFAKAPKAFERMYRGGGIAIFRRDERVARVAVVGDPLARYALHREAFNGGLLQVLEGYCDRPQSNELVECRAPDAFSFLYRW
jgi:hypothetical protein